LHDAAVLIPPTMQEKMKIIDPFSHGLLRVSLMNLIRETYFLGMKV